MATKKKTTLHKYLIFTTQKIVGSSIIPLIVLRDQKVHEIRGSPDLDNT